MGNWIVKNLKYFLDCVLEVFYGDDGCCILCGEYCEATDLQQESEADDKGADLRNIQLCPKCISDIKLCKDSSYLEIMGRSFKCYSAAYYSAGMKELVLRLKYKGDFRAGECIAYYMKELVLRERLYFDAVACVPSGHTAYKKRGYNQSHVLAQKLGKLLQVQVLDPLFKVQETHDQIGLDEASRWRNMEGNFKVKSRKAVQKKKILLIDDVITTGATAFFCAGALSDAGAEEVVILTAAKSRL